MDLGGVDDVGRRLIERVCASFLEEDDWPAFQSLEMEFLDERLGFVLRDLPPDLLVVSDRQGRRMVVPATVSVFAACSGTDGEVDRFLEVVRIFAKAARHLPDTDELQVTIKSLRESLGLSDREACRVARALEAWGGVLSTGGTRGADPEKWTFSVSPDALYFGEVADPSDFEAVCTEVRDIRMAEAEPYLRNRASIPGDFSDVALPRLVMNVAQLGTVHFHDAVNASAGSLLASGHPAEAVRAAAQRLEHYLQDAAQAFDETGQALVGRALGGESPAIAVNRLRDRTDRAEQEGILHLTKGVMAALRNPYSHGPARTLSQEEALEQLALISFLFRRLEVASAGAMGDEGADEQED